MPLNHIKDNRVRLLLVLGYIFVIPMLAQVMDLQFSYFVGDEGFYHDATLGFDLFITRFLFLMTETVSFPYGVITAFLLTLLIAKVLRFDVKEIIRLFLIVGVSIIIGLMIKTGIKYLTSEPRPYLVWLSQMKGGVTFDLNNYYQLDKFKKEALLEQIIFQPTVKIWHIPSWLADHWIKDKSYRFPSGHTFFAVFFVFLSAFLLPKKNYWIVYLLALWAMLIMLSRLYLGMHVPIDLMGGACVALIAAGLALLLIKKILYKNFSLGTLR